VRPGDREDPSVARARSELRAAWDEMLGELTRARDAIDQADLLPPPANERTLAEGYRYLLGFVHSAVERAFHADPRFPFVRHALQLVHKGTIDNADALYFSAPIDGGERYLLRGVAADHRHWRGAPPAPAGPKAPQYLIFELTDGGLTGDSGELAELRPGAKARTGWLDSSALEVGADGRFEILLAPRRPAGHTGNFIATRRRDARPHPDDPAARRERTARHLSGRQLFYDWEREQAVPLTITRLGGEGTSPPAYGPAAAAASLRELGRLVRGPMHFWNQFYTVLLETYGKPEGRDGEPFMPRNAFNRPNAASGATGGGQGTNLYAGGVYELEPDEALVVEMRLAVEPQYLGFHLANLWGESHDFANHQSSLNGFQAERDADGAIRLVVAHRDPGVPNWIDTTGHREGFQTARWCYSETPPRERWPSIAARKVRLAEIRAHLPAGTRSVSPTERTQRLSIRQAHVQRRYRVF